MRIARVVMAGGAEFWTVLEYAGDPVPEVEAFLAHLQALDRSPLTVRTYATSLKLWWQFLDRVGVGFDEVSVEHVSRFVAWLRRPGGERDGPGWRRRPAGTGDGESASSSRAIVARAGPAPPSHRRSTRYPPGVLNKCSHGWAPGRVPSGESVSDIDNPRRLSDLK